MLGAPVPILRSFDEGRARAFYVDFLGFDIEFEHRFADGMPLYLGLRKGDCVLHVSEHYGDASPGSAVRIPVDDVSAYMADLRRKKFTNAFPGEPEESGWGTREISIKDPAGNSLTFFSQIQIGSDGASS